MKRIAIINGPNLNLLGSREPSVYGTRTFEDYLQQLRAKFPEVELTYAQSNVEGELVSLIQEARHKDGLVLNAAAYTHTSVAIADAVKAIGIPTVEVHISNVFAREDFRHTSFLSPVCRGTITGLGLTGYELAIRALISQE